MTFTVVTFTVTVHFTLPPSALAHAFAAARAQAIGGLVVGRWAHWLPPTDLTDRVIYQLELLAVLWAILHWANRVRGGAIRLWIDNEAARYSILRGYSKNPWAARIVAEIWIQLAALDMALRVERVPTKENIGDGPSRLRHALLELLEIPLDTAIPAMERVAKLLLENTALLFGAAKHQTAR